MAGRLPGARGCGVAAVAWEDEPDRRGRCPCYCGSFGWRSALVLATRRACPERRKKTTQEVQAVQVRPAEANKREAAEAAIREAEALLNFGDADAARLAFEQARRTFARECVAKNYKGC